MSTKSELLKLLESHRGEIPVRRGAGVKAWIFQNSGVESYEEPPSGGIPDHGCE